MCHWGEAMREKKVIKLKREPGSRIRRWLAILIVASGFALLIYFFGIPFLISGGGLEDTHPIPGDAAHFDPVASYEQVSTYAGVGVELVSIRAQFVRSDGTMELNATYSPAPSVEYNFMRELSAPPPNAPPIGAGGANTKPWYEPIEIRLFQPGQWRKVTSAGRSYTYMNQGMQREISSAVNGLSLPIVKPPACSFSDLWAVALTKDAPPEAVATIDYNALGYQFSISGLSINLRFGADCKLRGGI